MDLAADIALLEHLLQSDDEQGHAAVDASAAGCGTS
jgi:hypothetical protein